jgi:hypothetical protein
MISMLKLKEYEEYRGYYDGFYMQKVKNLIGDLIQDIQLVNKGLVSKEFLNNLHKRLEENCDSDETVNQLRNLART